jgi:2-methylisocitrate lyase-like PEP mutase family enzyme
VEARGDSDLKIIARTDARAPLGLNAAMDRLALYKEAGADILFMDAIESPAEMERMAKEFPRPLMVNMSESGKTPLMPASDLEALGFSIVIFPSSMIRVMISVLGTFLGDLKAAGDSSPWLDRMATLDQTNEVLGLAELNDTGERIRAA